MFCSPQQDAKEELHGQLQTRLNSRRYLFFTLTLKNRKSDLLVKYIRLLGRSIRCAKKNNPLSIKSIVVLPDHLHMIIELPHGCPIKNMTSFRA